MNRMQLLISAVGVGLLPSLGSAALVASLDFTNNGSAWNIVANNNAAPLTFELGGDPTNVGVANITNAAGQYNLNQQVFAPAGFTMSNIRVEALGSGYSSWVMDGRLGFDDQFRAFALQNAYSIQGAETPQGGTVNVDVPLVLDASGDPDFTGITSIYVGVEIVKGLPGVWTDNNVRQIKVYADLTPVPEPSSMALVLAGGSVLLGRIRRRHV